MESSRPDTSILALSLRMKRIENENRRLKRLGSPILVIVGATTVMAQAPARRVVVADEFDLRDSAGRNRAVLQFVKGEPTFTLFDAAGHARATLTNDAIVFTDSNDRDRALLGSAFSSTYQQVSGKMQIIDEGPALEFFGTDKKPLLFLSGISQGAALQMAGPNAVRLESGPNGPSLWLTDAQGFQTAVGSVSVKTPTTGLSGRTSAASMVLFDNSGKSIWRVP